MDIDWHDLTTSIIHLTAAGIAGGILGFNREMTGAWAGLRTHMVVAVGAALFLLLARHLAEADSSALPRALEGIATGVGFLGAGTILKQSDRQSIRGLTTASSIWMSAGLGSVAGCGEYELLAAGTLMAVIVLVLFKPVSDAISEVSEAHHKDEEEQGVDAEHEPPRRP